MSLRSFSAIQLLSIVAMEQWVQNFNMYQHHGRSLLEQICVELNLSQQAWDGALPSASLTCWACQCCRSGHSTLKGSTLQKFGLHATRVWRISPKLLRTMKKMLNICNSCLYTPFEPDKHNFELRKIWRLPLAAVCLDPYSRRKSLT